MQCRTASGHAFRAYFILPDGTLKLVYEHRVLVSDDPDAEDTVSIQPCAFTGTFTGGPAMCLERTCAELLS